MNQSVLCASVLCASLFFPEEIEYHDDFDDFPPSLLESKNSDPDIYARLGRTMPPPSLPGELVLTDENFKERIKKAEKTAVLFYLSCKRMRPPEI